MYFCGMTQKNAALIFEYFPDLSETQVQQFEQLQSLYADWNSKINVISRKDTTMNRCIS